MYFQISSWVLLFQFLSQSFFFFFFFILSSTPELQLSVPKEDLYFVQQLNKPAFDRTALKKRCPPQNTTSHSNSVNLRYLSTKVNRINRPAKWSRQTDLTNRPYSAKKMFQENIFMGCILIIGALLKRQRVELFENQNNNMSRCLIQMFDQIS